MEIGHLGNVITLRTLPPSFRVLVTFFLITMGIGYLLAIAYLILIDIEPHRERGLTWVEGTIIKYYGKRDATKLEAAITGRMGGYLSDDQREQIIEWIYDGAQEKGFANLQPIFHESCGTCHGPLSGTGLADLTTYAGVTHFVGIDFGQSIKSLTRVSHIHLFGISFIFFLTGAVFALTEVNKWFRIVIVALPFVAIWMDIFSWWFTKVQPLFAYTVIIGGVLMGISLLIQIVVPLYEMWIKDWQRKEMAD